MQCRTCSVVSRTAPEHCTNVIGALEGILTPDPRIRSPKVGGTGLSGLPSSRRARRLGRRLLPTTLAFDRQQHLLLTGRGFSGLLALRGSFAGDALLQSVHEVYYIFTTRSGFWPNHLAIALGVDEFGQSLFGVVLELLRLERGGLLVDDVLCQIKHVLRDFHVLDLVEIFLLVPDFVGVSQERPHQTVLQRLQR